MKFYKTSVRNAETQHLMHKVSREYSYCVVVQVGAGKIYAAAAVEALRKKERQDETQFTIKIIMVFSVSTPPF
jgi:type II secretory pathway predicted ATPase ExeA